MKHRSGFTMIEILVACAVIVILMGLLFVGGKAIIASQKNKTTRATMENLKAMVTEYETARGQGSWKTAVDAAYAMAVTHNSQLTPPDIAIHPMDHHLPERIPQYENLGGTPPVYEPKNALAVTQYLMRTLLAIPANKKMIATLSKDHLLDTAKDAPGQFGSVPVLVDGFDQPLLFVPGTGFNTRTEKGGAGSPVLVRSKDGKPFIVSGGPDGSIIYFDTNHSAGLDSPDQTAGDDNVYSFEN